VKGGSKDHKKRLNPCIWGCMGCSVILVGMVALASIGIREAIKEIGKSAGGLSGTAQLTSLERVPGGILRRDLTGRQWMEVHSLQWRDDNRLCYSAIKMPGFDDMMGFSRTGMFVPFWDEEEMEKQGIAMASAFLSNPVQECDLQRGSNEAALDVPESVIIDYDGMAWSPDATRVAVSVVPIDMFMETRDKDTDNTLYVVNMRDAPQWTKLGEGTWPEWSADGRWIAFTRPGKGEKWERWVIRADGTGERRLPADACMVRGWGMDGDASTELYAMVHDEDAEEGFPYGITVVPLDGGKVTKTELRGDRVKLGALSEFERGFTKRRKDKAGQTFTSVGAVELSSGRVRWLSKNVPGSWECMGEILDGRGLVLVPWNRRESAAERKADKGTPTPAGEPSASGKQAQQDAFDSECRSAGVFSAIDGKLRDVPGLESDVRVSPDGKRLAWVAATEGRMYGVVPIPMADITVLDILYPEELIRGSANAQ